MRYARLGPSSVLVRVLITELGLPCGGFTPPFRGQGTATRFSRSSTNTSKQQALEKSLRPHRGSKPASKYLKTTGEPRRITTNKFRCISSHLARSTADLVSKNGRFWAVFGRFQDDRLEISGRSPLRQAGVSDEGRCSFMAFGLSNDGKWVFNKACTTPSCHAVVHFDVKRSRF